MQEAYVTSISDWILENLYLWAQANFWETQLKILTIFLKLSFVVQ